MAIISCPRCGGTGEEPSTGLKCRFCKGAKKVAVDEEEIKAWLKVSRVEKKESYPV